MRCRPNDLAVVVRADNPVNVGALVTVVRYSAELDEPAWVVRSEGRGLAGWEFLNGERLGESRAQEAICPDAWLRPIRPQTDADETPRDVPVDADGCEVVTEAV